MSKLFQLLRNSFRTFATDILNQILGIIFCKEELMEIIMATQQKRMDERSATQKKFD